MVIRQEQALRLLRRIQWTALVVMFQRLPVLGARASLAFPSTAGNLHPDSRGRRNRLQGQKGSHQSWLGWLAQAWREFVLHPPDAFPVKARATRKDHLRVEELQVTYRYRGIDRGPRRPWAWTVARWRS